MNRLFFLVLFIWPLIAFAYGQQNQTSEMIMIDTEDSTMGVMDNIIKNHVSVRDANDFWPNTLLDIVLILSGLATVVLVYVLWHQNRQTEISMKLSYGPVIHGRYHRRDGFPRLLIDNVGNGPALDLDLEIKTKDGKITLDTVKRLALTPDDPTHGTKVDLSKHPEVLLDGTYKDANRKTQIIHHLIQYPLMGNIEENENNEK